MILHWFVPIRCRFDPYF